MRLPAPTRPLAFAEQVFLLAALMAMMTFSIGSIMPRPDPRRQLRSRGTVARAAVDLGLRPRHRGRPGLGRPVLRQLRSSPALLLSVGPFIAGTLAARASGSLDTLLAWRFVRGLGAAASRIVNQAVTRGLFSVHGGLGLIVLVWVLLRRPATLSPEIRRPFRFAPVLAATWEVLRTPVALRYLIVSTLGFGQLIDDINSAQQIFTDTLGHGARFPL